MTLRTRTIAVGRKRCSSSLPSDLHYIKHFFWLIVPSLMVSPYGSAARCSALVITLLPKQILDISQLIVGPSTSCTIVCMCQPYVKENIMGYFKTQLTEMQDQQYISDIPLPEDYERIWLQDELEIAVCDGDYTRAAQLASLLESYNIQ